MHTDISDQSPVTDSFVENLATLQTRIADAIAGYTTMLRTAEPEIMPTVSEYLRTHKRHNHDLSLRLAALGKTPDEDGSFFSMVQKVVVEARALFDFVGINVLPQVIDGERRILELYNKTLDKAGILPDRSLLKGQMHDLERLDWRASELAVSRIS